MDTTISLSTLAEAGLVAVFVVGVIIIAKGSAGATDAGSAGASESNAAKKKKGKGKRKGIPVDASVLASIPTPAPAAVESAAKKRKQPVAVAAVAHTPPPAPPIPALIPSPAEPAPKIVKPTQAASKKAKKAAAAPPPPPAPLPTFTGTSASSSSESEDEGPGVIRIGKKPTINSDGWEEWPSLSSKADGAGEDDGWEVAKPKKPSKPVNFSLSTSASSFAASNPTRASVPGMPSAAQQQEQSKKQRANAKKVARAGEEKEALERERIERLTAHRIAAQRDRLAAEAKTKRSAGTKSENVGKRAKEQSGGMTAQINPDDGKLVWELKSSDFGGNAFFSFFSSIMLQALPSNLALLIATLALVAAAPVPRQGRVSSRHFRNPKGNALYPVVPFTLMPAASYLVSTLTRTSIFIATADDTTAITPYDGIASNLVRDVLPPDRNPHATSSDTVTTTLVAPSAGVPTPAPVASASTWSLAANFGSDLPAELGVKTWEWGQNSNVRVLAGVPATAWATPTSAAGPAPTAAVAHLVHPMRDLSNSTVMEVFYPNGSINPANKKAPVGGVGMYLTPLDLSMAKNVTLEYSVFFPVGFDFVKGGKLPGFYGGKTGCSGGKESEDCFSTRLMFRTGGLGEMYLYAPKGSQPPALCQTPPMSLCKGPYGFSIGRGSWTFKTGEWTRVRQTVVLNTPGVADGAFQVFINDELKLKSDAVVFRLAKAESVAPSPVASATASSSPSGAGESTPEPGLLGGLLGSAGLGDIVRARRAMPIGAGSAVPPQSSAVPNSNKTVFRTVGQITTVTRSTKTTQQVTATSTASQTQSPDPALLSGAKGVLGSLLNADPKEVTFLGVAMDTFFGGNSASYASSKDQYTYFNRMAMAINT